MANFGDILSSIVLAAKKSVRRNSADTDYEAFEPMDRTVYDFDDDGVTDLSRRTVIQVFNATGSTLTKGTAVYISGAQGDRPRVAKASASGYSQSTRPIGIIDDDIPNMEEGRAVTEGTVYGTDAFKLDTNAFNVGELLWVNPSTPGALTNTRPVQPAHALQIGYVARKHQNVGQIIVNPDNGEHLEWLHDVLLDTPLNDDVLTYETSSGLWKNKPAAGGGGGVEVLAINTTDTAVTNTTTDTHGYTIPAGKLASNGDTIRASFTASTVDAGGGSTFSFRFAGNDIGTLTMTSLVGALQMDVTIIRTSSTAGKVKVVSITDDGASIPSATVAYQNITAGVDWTGGQSIEFRITSPSASSTATARMSTVEFLPAP